MRPGKILRIIQVIFSMAVLAILCTTCLEDFPLPDVSRGFLVVEAQFTDQAGQSRVNLSFAGAVNEGGTPVSNATVYITDDLGSTGLFREDQDGSYLPEDSDFRSRGGRKYMLHIDLEDGRKYRSDTCLMTDVPPIDSLTWSKADIPAPDNTAWRLGVEFRLSNHDPENRVNHFLWTYDEIWEEPIPYPVAEEYLGNGEFGYIPNNSRCFVFGSSSEIMIKSTVDQAESAVRNFPIVFVSNETTRLLRKYRITVKQFGLTDEAFFYHQQLREITSQTGSVFDKQPFTLRGNIRNTTDPAEVVMGYFIVSALSMKYLTLDCNDLPREYRSIHYGYFDCAERSRTVSVNRNTNIDRIFERDMPRWGLVFVYSIWTGMIPQLSGLFFSPEECTCCRGTQEVPENWE